MSEAGNRLDAALENARRFFVGEADVQKALRKLARLLDEERIPYAIAGAIALNAYGYQRVTVDDGKKKPVAPDPAIAVRTGGIALLPLEKLVELKLASGLSAPHRLKDLADVLELIRAAGLPSAFADRLDGSVREKYRELWTAAQGAPAE